MSQKISKEKQAITVQKQFKMATEAHDPWCKYALDEQNILRWYILVEGVSGANDEFSYIDERGERVNGQYILVLDLSKDHPFSPPDFTWLTPNGLFQTNTRALCVHISKYHSQNYPAGMKPHVFAHNLALALLESKNLGGEGMGLIRTTDAKKRKLAAESRAYNREHHPEILEAIERSYAIYSKKWPQKK
jgi:ubiquitin-protein ligase